MCVLNRALRLAYMQSGGSDPEVLAHMHDLQAEALTLEQTKPKADIRTKERSKEYRRCAGTINLYHI